MRALFAIACVLGTTVGALVQGLSAREFTQWLLWMDNEQVGPQWQRLRHAELMAATGNAGRTQHVDSRPWEPRDFLRADPWAPPPAPAAAITPAQRKAQHDAWLRRQEEAI